MDEIEDSFVVETITDFFASERKLIRTIVIATSLIIIIIGIFYFNYILIGEFFSPLFLAFIVSHVLKPSKDKLIKRIENHLTKKEYFSSKSFIVFILAYIFDIVIKISTFLFSLCFGFNRERRVVIREGDAQDNEIPQESILNSLSLLIITCFIYIIIFKLKIVLSITLIFSALLTDFCIRLLLDTSVKLSTICLGEKVFLNENKKAKNSIHSIVTSVLIFFFIFFFIFVFLLGLVMFYIDLSKMYRYFYNNNEIFRNFTQDNISDLFTKYKHNLLQNLTSVEFFITNNFPDLFPGNNGSNHTLYTIVSSGLTEFWHDPIEVVDNFLSNNNQTISLQIKQSCTNTSNYSSVTNLVFTIFHSPIYKMSYCRLIYLLEKLNFNVL